jgi:hypothetical protein
MTPGEWVSELFDTLPRLADDVAHDPAASAKIAERRRELLLMPEAVEATVDLTINAGLLGDDLLFLARNNPTYLHRLILGETFRMDRYLHTLLIEVVSPRMPSKLWADHARLLQPGVPEEELLMDERDLGTLLAKKGVEGAALHIGAIRTIEQRIKRKLMHADDNPWSALFP